MSCNHGDLTVQIVTKRHNDELVKDLVGPLILWIGDIVCTKCNERLFITKEAFVCAESGALGFQLLTSDQKYNSFDGKNIPELPDTEKSAIGDLFEMEDMEELVADGS